MASYNPNVPPNASDWLEIDEPEQIGLVAAYHAAERTPPANAQMHALIHVVVENQLAEGIDVAGEALTRLMDEGLDRHEAIHAIGSVLVKHLRDLMMESAPGSRPHERYFEDLRALNRSSWDRELV